MKQTKRERERGLSIRFVLFEHLGKLFALMILLNSNDIWFPLITDLLKRKDLSFSPSSFLLTSPSIEFIHQTRKRKSMKWMTDDWWTYIDVNNVWRCLNHFISDRWEWKRLKSSINIFRGINKSHFIGIRRRKSTLKETRQKLSKIVEFNWKWK